MTVISCHDFTSLDAKTQRPYATSFFLSLSVRLHLPLSLFFLSFSRSLSSTDVPTQGSSLGARRGTDRLPRIVGTLSSSFNLVVLCVFFFQTKPLQMEVENISPASLLARRRSSGLQLPPICALDLTRTSQVTNDEDTSEESWTDESLDSLFESHTVERDTRSATVASRSSNCYALVPPPLSANYNSAPPTTAAASSLRAWRHSFSCLAATCSTRSRTTNTAATGRSRPKLHC